MQMLPFGLDSAWRSGLQRRANRAPDQPRLPLFMGSAEIGSVALTLMERLVTQGLAMNALNLVFKNDQLGARWCLDGAPTLALERLALALNNAGLVRTWHGELLSVMDPTGRCIGAVERGVARLLGISVHCVHLVGVVDGVGSWVQQRSMAKAEGPGLWDTLMGGTVPFGESPGEALQRELWEEAGLKIKELCALEYRGRVRVAHPLSDDDGLSYCVDHIDCHMASLAADVVPVNRDGEVIQFRLLPPPILADWLVADLFTLEAASVLSHVQAFDS